MDWKHLFLDVDGVLNTQSDWNRLFVLNPACMEQFRSFLSILSHYYALRCVLSSSWRTGFSLNEAQCTPQVLELCRFLASCSVRSFDKTPELPSQNRWEEISSYRKAHDIALTECLIIDDDISLFPTFVQKKDFFLLCNPKTGFRIGNDIQIKMKRGEQNGIAKIAKRISSFF